MGMLVRRRSQIQEGFLYIMCRQLTLYDRFSRAILRGITALGSLICVWGSGGWFLVADL